MTSFFLACAAFLGLHLGVSGTRLRAILVARVGAGPYRGAFALLALACLIWICRSYGGASASPDNLPLFDPPAVRAWAWAVMGVAFFLAIPGFVSKNPTSDGQQGAALYGVQKITRHPFLWGTALWAGVHLIGAGSLAASVLFATFLILALVGTVSIDAKARARLGAEAWSRLAGQSSNLPFAAVMAGKTGLSVRECFDWRFAVSAAVFAGFLAVHAGWFAVSPFPDGFTFPF